jgi:hypothetical protein
MRDIGHTVLIIQKPAASRHRMLCKPADSLLSEALELAIHDLKSDRIERGSALCITDDSLLQASSIAQYGCNIPGEINNKKMYPRFRR